MWGWFYARDHTHPPPKMALAGVFGVMNPFVCSFCHIIAHQKSAQPPTTGSAAILTSFKIRGNANWWLKMHGLHGCSKPIVWHAKHSLESATTSHVPPKKVQQCNNGSTQLLCFSMLGESNFNYVLIMMIHQLVTKSSAFIW